MTWPLPQPYTIGPKKWASAPGYHAKVTIFFSSILIVATGVYAARSLYFAVMQKGRIPLALTGTAVGLISLVGYTPDIFAGPAMGLLLDHSPGEAGHQQVFWMLAVFSFLGGIAAWYYYRLYRQPKTETTRTTEIK